MALQKQGIAAAKDVKDMLLQKLKESQGVLNLNDDSPPELIHRVLGISKKNFKKAVGMLYKEGKIELTEKEHFVFDLPESEYGIYNGLMVSKPGNTRLFKAIENIVDNVKNNFVQKIAELTYTDNISYTLYFDIDIVCNSSSYVLLFLYNNFLTHLLSEWSCYRASVRWLAELRSWVPGGFSL